jgi:hypothetical protein
VTPASLGVVVLSVGALALLAWRARHGERSPTSARAIALLLTATLAGYALATMSLPAAALATTLAIAAAVASTATHDAPPG